MNIKLVSASASGGANLSKIIKYAVITNAIQIVAAAAVAIYAVFSKNFSLSSRLEITLTCILALVVIWGAVLDIREAYSARRSVSQREMLEDAYIQLEALNGQLRAQRHDFMNHVQVIYSLTEMDERESALEYMDMVYKDLQKVSRALKTSSPAINALIAAKMADCDERGIAFDTDIRSDWKACPVPSWEMCRILGNIIDNAVDALTDTKRGSICVSLWEDVRSCRFAVENNGAPIPPEIRESIFGVGFSTKGEGRGTGLSIVKSLAAEYGGSVYLDEKCENTRFVGEFPRSVENA